MLLKRIKQFDLVFWVLMLCIAVVLCSAILQSISMLVNNSKTWKFLTELGQLLGSLGTVATLIWLIQDRKRELRESEAKFLAEKKETAIKFLKEKLNAKTQQVFAVSSISGYHYFDQFDDDVVEVRDLLSQIVEIGDINAVVESKKSVYSTLVQNSNKIDFSVLLSFLTSSQIKVSKNVFAKCRFNTMVWFESNQYYRIVPEEIRPHFIDALAVLGLARLYGDGGMANFCMAQFLETYLRPLKDSNDSLAAKINDIDYVSRVKSMTRHSRYQASEILRVFRMPKLSGAHMAMLPVFDQYEIKDSSIKEQIEQI